MAAFIDLQPGLPVHVLPPGGALEAAYGSVIRQVTNSGVRIEPPQRDGATMALAPGDAVTFYVQMQGRIYRLESRVRMVEQGAEESVVLEPPSEAERTERREFYRLMTTLNARYAARVSPEGDELERLDVTILDISGGGMQVHCKQWAPVGSRLRITFRLEDDPQDIDATAIALSVARPDPRRSVYRVHCRFIELPRSHQERIVRWVFRKQVDFRKKGVG
jgi:c-di-GMP-binding flagellar brake protein YcgR